MSRRSPDFGGLWPAILVGAIAVLGVASTGVCLDMIAAIRDPYGLDYGEGIVWQQAALIPGSRMYGAGQGLPFIVFHYPPLYYLVTRGISGFMPDLLSAGRLVSSVSTLAVIPIVAGLVLVAGRRGSTRPAAVVLFAVFAGLLAFTLHVVRTWGMYMRVDMLSVALGLSGVLVAALANGRLRGTTLALLLCLAAVYCRQTQLPAGIAVFLITVLRRPTVAIIASTVTLTVGLGALGAMQWITAGGFLQNIVGYNINRFDPSNAVIIFELELINLPVMLLAAVAATAITWGLRPLWPLRALRQRLADRDTAARAMVLMHYVLASLMLATMFKSGGAPNYLIDWLCVGCALIGVWLCEPIRLARNGWIVLLLSINALLTPYRQQPNHLPVEETRRQAALVRRVADAAKPVASEDMVVLMRAGKPVIYEPAIVTELSALGHWDERPLVDMIDTGGFAFMITSDDAPGPTSRRSPAVDAAMRRALPRVEPAADELWLHLPR